MAGAASANPVKAPDLEIDEAADGYIVYQPDRDRVHYLNRTAALVLELCNGRNAEADLPELLQLAWDLPAPPVEEVAECLKLLSMQGLIDADFAAGPAVSGFLLKLQPEFDRFVSAHIRRYRVWEPLENSGRTSFPSDRRELDRYRRQPRLVHDRWCLVRRRKREDIRVRTRAD